MVQKSLATHGQFHLMQKNRQIKGKNPGNIKTGERKKRIPGKLLKKVMITENLLAQGHIKSN